LNIEKHDILSMVYLRNFIDILKTGS